MTKLLEVFVQDMNMFMISESFIIIGISFDLILMVHSLFELQGKVKHGGVKNASCQKEIVTFVRYIFLQCSIGVTKCSCFVILPVQIVFFCNWTSCFFFLSHILLTHCT